MGFEHGGVRAGAVERGHPVESVDDVEKLFDLGGEFPRFRRVLPWGGLRRVHRCSARFFSPRTPPRLFWVVYLSLCVEWPQEYRILPPDARHSQYTFDNPGSASGVRGSDAMAAALGCGFLDATAR